MQLSTLKEWLGPTASEALSFLYWNIAHPLLHMPSLHWGYLLSNLFVAWLFFQWVARREAPQGTGFWSWMFPKAVWRHPSSAVDLRFYLVTQVMMANLKVSTLVVGLVALLHLQDDVVALFALVLPAPVPRLKPGIVANVGFTIAMGIAFDYARYLSHRLHHSVPLLWEFHKVHHSAQVLNIFTGFRNHPVEGMIELALRLVATALVSGVFGFFYPEGLMEATLLNYGFLTFLFYLTAHLRHSNVPIDFGALRTVFISPRMHQLHHSADSRHFDRNFGFILSFWDRIAGTLYLPRRDEQFELGLPPDAGRFDSATACLVTPFVQVWRKIARRPERQSAP
jgi:sterol desaturase/sphingolipid hydroxylase (fatty acid hydroxylase superfamily)